MMRTTIIKAVVAAPVAVLLFLGAFAFSPLGITAKAQATISAGEAEQAALAAIPGTVVEPTELQDENGLQVYGVIIQADDGSGKWDVKVDAATGQVVSTEADNGNEGGGKEDGSDGDGETDDDQGAPAGQVQLAILSPHNGSALSNKALAVAANVSNPGKTALQNISVDFQLDGRKIGTKTVANLKPGQSKKIVLKASLKALSKAAAAAVPMATKLGALKPGVHFLTVMSKLPGSKATIRLTLTAKSISHSMAASTETKAQTPTVEQAQLFTMGGQLVSQETLKAGSNVSAQSFAGRSLAKGVYLYVVTTFDQSGLAIKKRVNKLVIH